MSGNYKFVYEETTTKRFISKSELFAINLLLDSLSLSSDVNLAS